MKFLNISIHDLTPSTFDKVSEIVSMLNNLGIKKISFLVIPNYHGRESVLQISHEVRTLIGENEVILHGYTHLGERFPVYSYRNLFTNYEGEFFSYTDVVDRLRRGVQTLKLAGLDPVGFIPPAWLMRKQDFKTLKEFGFRFTTDRRYLYDLVEEKRFLSPVLTFSCRPFMDRLSISTFRIVSGPVCFLKIVRLAIHPGDVMYPEKIRLISNFIRRNRNLRVSSFCEILDEIKLTQKK